MAALAGQPNVGFDIPENIVTAPVDRLSGYRSHDGYPDRLEYFIRGTESGEDPVHLKLKVCKNDGKIANPSDISSGNYEEKEYYLFKEEDPTAGPGGSNKWQEGILNWLNGQSDEKYHPPTEYCGSTNPVSVDFIQPGNESSDLASNFDIKIKAESTTKIGEVVLYIDGERIRGFTSSPYEYSADLLKGTHELKAWAKDKNGKEADRTIKIGVGVAWDYVPATPTPSPNPTPTP